MGFRYRKRTKLAPGLKVNWSKGLPSVSVGRPGATVNLGKRGVRSTVGLPGTGISYTTQLGGKRRVRTSGVASGGYSDADAGALADIEDTANRCAALIAFCDEIVADIESTFVMGIAGESLGASALYREALDGLRQGVQEVERAETVQPRDATTVSSAFSEARRTLEHVASTLQFLEVRLFPGRPFRQPLDAEPEMPHYEVVPRIQPPPSSVLRTVWEVGVVLFWFVLVAAIVAGGVFCWNTVVH